MFLNKSHQSSFDTRPIGIFDSGVGGLSIAKRIAQELPHEHLIYIADNLHSPYGNKSSSEIQKRVNNIANSLIENNCKTIVIACNTATVAAIEQLRATVNLPIIGVEPAIKPAAIHSRNRQIGIMVTKSTAMNKRFLALINRFSTEINVHIQPCPRLVELIEAGKHDGAECETILKQYLKTLCDKNIDTLVLGCTHYPFLTTQIRKIMGYEIKIMETALPVAEQLKRQLDVYQLNASHSQLGVHQFFSTNNSSQLNTIMNQLWAKPIVVNSI